jgi:hypothetical protein
MQDMCVKKHTSPEMTSHACAIGRLGRPDAQGLYDGRFKFESGAQRGAAHRAWHALAYRARTGLHL